MAMLLECVDLCSWISVSSPTTYCWVILDMFVYPHLSYLIYKRGVIIELNS